MNNGTEAAKLSTIMMTGNMSKNFSIAFRQKSFLETFKKVCQKWPQKCANLP